MSKALNVDWDKELQRHVERDKPSTIDDLILVEDVSEESILTILEVRISHGEMYTSIGPVLIAVNPYENLQRRGCSVYDDHIAQHYFEQEATHIVPHIFRVGGQALRSLVADSENQCIIITGESGSGKTEAAKHLMHFVTVAGTTSHKQREKTGRVKRQVFESNPLLESFGNAKTLRNDNSSRFGKYMELQVSYRGEVMGGRVTNYLLEKSRVCAQAPGEGNFHIFHYIVSGSTAQEKKDLGILDTYVYLRTENISNIDENVLMLKSLKESMSAVGVSNVEQTQLFRTLSGILALGNISFQDNGDGHRATVKKDSNILDHVAELLQVPANDLEMALTSVSIMVGKDKQGQLRLLTAVDSEKNRDTLAKELYRQLFDWLVSRINEAMTLTASTNTPSILSNTRKVTNKNLTIGILDIYGFEIFDTNGFEQFCINYVNEKLQQYFIDHTIRAEQEEYHAEGISWGDIDFFNNATVLDLIEGRTGLLAILDEQCAFRDSTYLDLISRYNRSLTGHPHYIPGKRLVYGDSGMSPLASGQTSPQPPGSPGDPSSPGKKASFLVPKELNSPVKKASFLVRKGSTRLDTNKLFGVNHYAGTVGYTVDQFLEKNGDSLYHDLGKLMESSGNAITSALFGGYSSRTSEQRAKRPLTISQQFKKQVQSLCDSLALSKPHYVRCMKPNDNKVKATIEFDKVRMSHQVTYLGLIQNIAVRRQGFIYRSPFTHFVKRYGFLSTVTWPDKREVHIWEDGTICDSEHPEPPEPLLKRAYARRRSIAEAYAIEKATCAVEFSQNALHALTAATQATAKLEEIIASHAHTHIDTCTDVRVDTCVSDSTEDRGKKSPSKLKTLLSQTSLGSSSHSTMSQSKHKNGGPNVSPPGANVFPPVPPQEEGPSSVDNGGSKLTAEEVAAAQVEVEKLEKLALLAKEKSGEASVVALEAEKAAKNTAELTDAATQDCKKTLTKKMIWMPARITPKDGVTGILTAGCPKSWPMKLTGGKRMRLEALKISVDNKEVAFGNTKVFIRHPGTLFDLEAQRTMALPAVATLMQCNIRAYCYHQRYLRVKVSIIKTHAVARGFIARSKHRTALKSITRIQSLFRGGIDRKMYRALHKRTKGVPPRVYALRIQRLRRGNNTRKRQPAALIKKTLPMGKKILKGVQRLKAGLLIQRVWRGYGPRKTLRKVKGAVVAVQCMVKCHNARAKRRDMLEVEYATTIQKLQAGYTVTKHAIKKTVGTQTKKEATVTLSTDCRSISWDTGSVTSRGGKGVKLVDIASVCKGRATETLKLTGDVKKSEEGLHAGGCYISILLANTEKTVDLECATYKERDALYRALDRLRSMKSNQPVDT